jgi:hypothetical protein
MEGRGQAFSAFHFENQSGHEIVKSFVAADFKDFGKSERKQNEEKKNHPRRDEKPKRIRAKVNGNHRSEDDEGGANFCQPCFFRKKS